MKKSIKCLALGLAVVPCALVLTACGSKEPAGKVDVKGNYTEVSTSSYSETLSACNTDISSFANNMRILSEAEIDFSGLKISLKSDTKTKNLTYIGTEKGDEVQVVSKNTIKIPMGDQKSTYDVNAYIDDAKAYIDASEIIKNPEQNSKYYIALDGIKSEYPLESIETTTDFSSILELFPDESTWGEDILIEKYVNGKTTKLKITINGEYVKSALNASISENPDMSMLSIDNLDDITVYIVFNDNELEGFAANFSATLTVYADKVETLQENVTISVKESLNVTKYTGNLSMPSFNGYQELDMNGYLPQ